MQLDKFTLKSQEAIQAAHNWPRTTATRRCSPSTCSRPSLSSPTGWSFPCSRRWVFTRPVVLSETNQLIEQLPKVSGGGAGQHLCLAGAAEPAGPLL